MDVIRPGSRARAAWFSAGVAALATVGASGLAFEDVQLPTVTLGVVMAAVIPLLRVYLRHQLWREQESNLHEEVRLTLQIAGETGSLDQLAAVLSAIRQ